MRIIVNGTPYERDDGTDERGQPANASARADAFTSARQAAELRRRRTARAAAGDRQPASESVWEAVVLLAKLRERHDC